MRQALVILCMIVAAFLMAMDVYAQVEPISPQAAPNVFNLFNWGKQDQAKLNGDFLKSINAEPVIEDDLADTPAQKIGDGVINAATSWTDIPRDIIRVSEEQDIVVGATYGFGEGIVNGIARGVTGAIDVATFGIPNYNEPIMQPEYKVDKPQQEGLKIALFKW